MEFDRTSWDRIVSWLHAHAPASAEVLLEPEPDAVGRLEAALGFALPEDVAGYVAEVGGTRRSVQGDLVTSFQPMGLTQVLGVRDMLLGVWDAMADVDDWRARARQNGAGSWSGPWLPEFVPLADGHTGDYLFVDLRAGEQRGCVGRYRRDDGAQEHPPWPSVQAMLDDVAHGLETGTPVQFWVPTVIDGRLDWDFEPPPPPPPPVLSAEEAAMRAALDARRHRDQLNVPIAVQGWSPTGPVSLDDLVPDVPQTND